MLNQNESMPHQKLETRTITLLDGIEILLLKKRLIISVTVLALIISTVISFLLPKTYSSTTRILPPQQDNGLMGMMMGAVGGGGMTGLASDLLGKGTAVDLYVGMLNSEALMDAIIDRFNLMDVY